MTTPYQLKAVFEIIEGLIRSFIEAIKSRFWQTDKQFSNDKW